MNPSWCLFSSHTTSPCLIHQYVLWLCSEIWPYPSISFHLQCSPSYTISYLDYSNIFLTVSHLLLCPLNYILTTARMILVKNKYNHIPPFQWLLVPFIIKSWHIMSIFWLCLPFWSHLNSSPYPLLWPSSCSPDMSNFSGIYHIIPFLFLESLIDLYTNVCFLSYRPQINYHSLSPLLNIWSKTATHHQRMNLFWCSDYIFPLDSFFSPWFTFTVVLLLCHHSLWSLFS